MTPYPGTETWFSETRRLTTRDFRLFDIQHAVMPTQLPLEEFYQELVSTQAIVYKKFLGLRGFAIAAPVIMGNLLRGSTNVFRFLTQFPKVYNPQQQIDDHQQSVNYEIYLPQKTVEKIDPAMLYVHDPRGRKSRALDDASEAFVELTRFQPLIFVVIWRFFRIS